MDFFPQPTKENLRIMIAWWLFALAMILWSQWRTKRGVGLPVAYALGLSLIHLSGALVYSMDFYQPRSAYLLQGGFSLQNTCYGFYVAVIGLGAFTAGCLVCPILFIKTRPRLLAKLPPQVTSELPGTLLLISLLFFFFLRGILNRLPSLASISTAGSYVSVIAFTWFLRETHRKKLNSKFMGWLAGTALLPVFTVIFMGFAGFGIMAAITVWALVLCFYRPRWVSASVLLVVTYLGLSLYVNYMRERDSIRESVWHDRSMSSRLDRATKMFTRFELFDCYSQVHLEMVDMRLNQNNLVGMATTYMAAGRVSPAEGGTFYAAALAVIPRILWPGKPNTGGSGSLVNRFTGFKVAEGTSMGVGQVLEFYVNWQLPSVIIGFFLFGMVMKYLDQRSGEYLAQGDMWNATRWLLPGMGMLMPEGSMAELVGSMAGNTVFVLGLHRFLFAQYYNPENIRLPRQPGRGSRVPRSAL